MSMTLSKSLVIGFLSVVCLMLKEAHGTEFTVGDANGWSPCPGLSQWTDGKTFKAGDILIFKYTNPSFYVEALQLEEYYNNCDPYPDAKKQWSGNDSVVLDKGFNYYVPFDTSYCQKGMKLKVFANSF